jgi:hypothetical protein
MRSIGRVRGNRRQNSIPPRSSRRWFPLTLTLSPGGGEGIHSSRLIDVIWPWRRALRSTAVRKGSSVTCMK